MTDWTALVIFTALFGAVTVLGFAAAYWQRGDLAALHEWALGGRRFGTLISWFLLGGDIYTAYTFVALPALVYGLGAPAFFPLLLNLVVYPALYVFGPRFWTIAHKRGYITYADFVRDRFDSAPLEVIVAATGIVATMLYIALQLVGLQVVIAALGLGGSGWLADAPVIVAFLILAAYTYRSGLRAPALVAVVKDVLIFFTVAVVIVVVPAKLGGFSHMFAAAASALAAAPKPGAVILAPPSFVAYATLGLGSGLALFMYPNVMTAVLSTRSTDVVRRNMALLPIYTIMLAFMAMFGYMVLAAGIHVASPNDAVPALIKAMFPSWFIGVAFAAIGIGALVPAAVMSIAAANLYTRNIHRAIVGGPIDAARETRIAKLTSLIVKAGALAAVLFISTKYAIYYQLFAGSLILQTLPAVIFGLYTTWFHRGALIGGWIAGIACALWMIVAGGLAPTYTLHIFGQAYTGFIALYAFAANLIVIFPLSVVLDRLGVRRGVDRTQPSDYEEAPST